MIKGRRGLPVDIAIVLLPKQKRKIGAYIFSLRKSKNEVLSEKVGKDDLVEKPGFVQNSRFFFHWLVQR